MKRSLKKYLAGMACAMGALLVSADQIHAASPNPDQVLLNWNQTWKYLVPMSLANDPDQDQNEEYVFTEDWFKPTFNDDIPVLVFDENEPDLQGEIPWREGVGPFDYGTVDGFANIEPAFPRTTIDPAPASGDRASVYFRTTFNLAAPASSAVFDYVFDDRAVVYIDGVEVTDLRTAPDTAGALPLFATQLTTDSEALRTRSVTFPAPLTAGNHTLAVIMHQAGTGSSDLGMGLRAVSPGNGTRVWTTDVSGDWQDTANWRSADPATTQTEFAVFGAAYTAQHTIWNDQDVALDGIQFENTNTYNIGGRGVITLQGNNRNASLNALSGSHELQAPVRLGRNTDINIVRTTEPAVDAAITLRNQFNLDGRTATLTGGGELRVMSRRTTGTTGTLTLTNGSLAGDGIVRASVNVGAQGSVNPSGRSAASLADARPSLLTIANNATFTAGSNLTLNLYGNGLNDKLVVSQALNVTAGPTVNIALVGTYAPAAGDSFDVLDWGTKTGPLPAPSLPALGAGLTWNTSLFDSQGRLSVTGGPAFDPCDFDQDGDCDVNDVNALTRVGNLVTGVPQGNPAYQAKYDLNTDNTINTGDITAWLAGAATENGWAQPYYLGDSDLNGKVEFADFVNLNNNWQRSTLGDGSAVAWQFGDFNGDKIVDFADFVAQNNNWQRMNTAAGALAAQVPEPTGAILFALGLLGLGARRRR